MVLFMVIIKKSVGLGAFDAVPGELKGIKKHIAFWNHLIAVGLSFLVVYFIVALLFEYYL